MSDAVSRPPYFDARRKMWVVTRYDDARRVLSDSTEFTATGAYFSQMTQAGPGFVHSDHMACSDGDLHARLRGSIAPFFESIERFEFQIRELADDLAIAAAGNPHPIDLASCFARPLSMRSMLAVVGFGIDREPDACSWFDAWSRIEFGGSAEAMDVSMVERWCTQIEHLIDHRKSAASDDLASAASSAIRRGVITLGEAVQQICHIFAAGIDTTSAAMSTLLLHAIRRRDRLALLAVDNDEASRFVDESLRCNVSIRGPIRVAKSDQKLGSIIVKKGELVYVDVTKANRDSDTFVHSERFDAQRRNARAHLTFGYGPHYCLGARLARLELRCGLQAIAKTLPTIRLDRRGVEVVETPFFPVISSLWASPSH